MTFDFGEILTKAWQVVWKYKILWVFGFLVSCGQGGGGGGGGSNTGYQFSSGDQNLPPEVRRFFMQIEHFFEFIEAWQIIAFIAGLILFIILMNLLFLALKTLGRVGMIQGTLLA